MSLKDTLKKAKRIEQQLEQQLDGDNSKTLSSRAVIKPRNYLALNPLMEKGGLHESDNVKIARKKQRRNTKQELRKTDWLNEQ